MLLSHFSVFALKQGDGQDSGDSSSPLKNSPFHHRIFVQNHGDTLYHLCMDKDRRLWSKVFHEPHKWKEVHPTSQDTQENHCKLWHRHVESLGRPLCHFVHSHCTNWPETGLAYVSRSETHLIHLDRGSICYKNEKMERTGFRPHTWQYSD